MISPVSLFTPFSFNLRSNLSKSLFLVLCSFPSAFAIATFVVFPVNPLLRALSTDQPSPLPMPKILYRAVAFIFSLLSRYSKMSFFCSRLMCSSSFSLFLMLRLLISSQILHAWNIGDDLGATLGPDITSSPELFNIGLCSASRKLLVINSH